MRLLTLDCALNGHPLVWRAANWGLCRFKKTLFSAVSLASALLGPPPRGPSRRLPKMQKTQELALEMAERHRFSIYDGLIVAAAVRAGCTILYTQETCSRGSPIG